MAQKVTYANYETIKPYMTGDQRRWTKANQEEPDCNWLVTFHMLHNDGPNVRVEFRINRKEAVSQSHLTVDIPLEVFNNLPRIEVAA